MQSYFTANNPAKALYYGKKADYETFLLIVKASHPSVSFECYNCA